MLDAFIIEQLKRIERRREQERRPRMELPCDAGEDTLQVPGEVIEEQGERPRVIIIDYGA